MKLFATGLVVVLLLLAEKSFSQDEYFGPFPSWANAKQRFLAKGDGKTDDTRSLQKALDSFTVSLTAFNITARPYVVLYLPAGVYNISRTLVLKGKIGITIIGEDPKNTIIRWTGNDSDTMLWANGSAYFKISRLTWDAGNKKGIECIGIHWSEKWRDATSQSYAPLNIELSDLVFKGAPSLGISGGTLGGGGIYGTGANDSEILIKRCSFTKCSEAGIRISGYNALDYWIWYCKFIDCTIGVQNLYGNFHIYRSFFKGSTFSDTHTRSGYYTSIRESYSLNSGAFSMDDGSSCNPFKRIFQGNTILNTKEMPVEYLHLGSITLLDNRISEGRNKEYPFMVNHSCWCTHELSMLSLGNTYGYKNPLRIAKDKVTLIASDDKILKVPLADGTAFEKSMPSTPVRSQAKIFEIPQNAGSDIIQKIINDASRLKGSKPVIHFSIGKYYIDRPLIIPAGSDIRMVGDGQIYSSQILPVSNPKLAGKFLLEVNGPSYISLQDIQIGALESVSNTISGILLKKIDQAKATCILDQIYSMSDSSLVATGLDYLKLEKNNSFFTSGNYISGGKLQKAGKGSFTVNCFGGQFANLTVTNNAKFLAKDCWWEGPQRQPLYLQGDGEITIDGAMIAPVGADSATTITIQDFKGKVSLLNMYIQGGIDIRPNNPQLKFFGWNLHFYWKLNTYDFLNKKSDFTAMFEGITVQNFDNKNPVGLNPYFQRELKLNISNEKGFVKEMLNQTRTNNPIKQLTNSTGISSVKINRITLGYMNKGIAITN